MMKNIQNRNRIFFAGILFANAVLLGSTGCTYNRDEEPMVILDSGDDSYTEYSFVQVDRGDVRVTDSVKCVYRKNDEQEVFFPVSGKVITKVYVEQGDAVKKGDVLAEISVGTLQAEIKALEYRIARNELLLGYLDEEEQLDMQGFYLNYLYGSGQSDKDKENLEKNLDNLYDGNDSRRRGYDDDLEFDRRKLSALRKEYASSRVYAQFDGKVSSVEEGLEGSTSNVEKSIMTIVDNSEGYFETEDADHIKYFNEGEIVQMKVSVGNGKGNYELLPLDMEEWGETQKFSIFSGDDTENLEVGTQGSVTVVLEKHTGVLRLPSSCVHSAGDASYVYVENAEGLREVVWIETGISGEGMTEILSGLNEGDSVIKR
ncbi:MAG: efflux RND transporter periplasmic adaptor subunit [Lachnospiraceae bacterium]|nr:efflux RND transporter periplasmic adaptor subunit [Lachnospiraceae bacterium]